MSHDPNADPGLGATLAPLAAGGEAPSLQPATDGAEALPEVSPALYRVEGEFARGGLGRILSAQDLRLAREVALKESLSQDPAINRRFVREALITARLQHPAIIPVYQAGRWPSGAPFYAMRRVAGCSLAAKIQEIQSGAGDADARLSARLALLPRLLTAIEAVAYAHHRGVIHRDLKPENILVGDFGETVVIDWGLAKDLGEGAAGEPAADAAPALSAAFGGPSQSGRETAFGAILGTAEFMPPEQAEGSPVDRRADVYAIGAILYELLAGRAAYLGDTPMAVLLQVLHGPPPALSTRQPGLPRDLCALVAKAMARAPDERYADAGALAEDLRRFLTGRLVAAHRYSALDRLRRTVSQHRAAVAVGVLGLLALLVTSVLSLQRIISARRAAERAFHQATRRANALLLLQARASLRSDPTAALAWLKLYPAAGPAWSEAHAIASEAAGRGVARHVLRGHRGAVNHAAWSPTGDRVVSGGADGTVRSYDLTQGGGAGVVLGFHDNNEAVSAVAFAPDGGLVASAGGDGAVRLWDPRRQRPARVLAGHHGRVGGARFSPDGATLLSFGEDGTARLWALAQGTQRVLAGQTDEILQAIFVSDGARVVSGGRDRAARLFTVAGGAAQVLAAPPPQPGGRRHRPALPPQPTGHGDHITDLAASADGRWLASGSRDRTVWLWDLETAAGRLFATHPALVTRVAFSPDGATLATASQDGAVRLFAVRGGAERVLTRHAGAVVTLAFSPDGGTLASGGSDPVVRLSDVKTGVTRSLLGHSGAVTHLSFSPDGAWLLSASRDGSLRVWPSGRGQGQSLAGHSDHVTHLSFSPDGWTLASASRDRTVRLWDLRSGDARVLRGHEDAVAKLAWSPDGRALASASNDDTARLWPVAGDAPARVLRGHSSDLMGVVFSPDGATVATASVDRTVRLWRRGDGEALRVLRGPTGGVWTLAFTPSGGGLFGAGLDRAVYFWGLWRGAAAEPLVFRGHGGSIDAIAVEPQGRYAASAGGDGTVRTWPVPDQGGAPAVLRGHDAPVGSLAFAPDGALASGGQDGGVFLWAPGAESSGLLLGRCASAVSAVAFSRDGALLAAAARDGTARVWTRRSGAVRITALAGPLRTLAFSPDGAALALGSEAAEVRVVAVSALPLIPAAPAALREWLTQTTSARIEDADAD